MLRIIGVFKETGVWSLVFVVFALVFSTAALPQNAGFISGTKTLPKGENPQDYGGPADGTDFTSGAILGFSFPVGAKDVEARPWLAADGSAYFGYSSPFSNLIPTRNGLRTYKVREGDTLSGIAAQFGISLATLRGANPGTRNTIRPGDELIILPVTGALYTVQEGDTLESVSVRYETDPELVKQYNPNYGELFAEPGSAVILPYAKITPSAQLRNVYAKLLPDLGSYFQLPARGWNWGELHDYNAVDIADACGEPVYAAAEGLVGEESSSGSWNQGYGNYVLVEHPNGTKTRYAHLDEIVVGIGEYVAQGEKIATIGNTGNTHGPTGCHLHFEVLGAKNPFVIK